jgi:hypothetical protein
LAGDFGPLFRECVNDDRLCHTVYSRKKCR